MRYVTKRRIQDTIMFGMLAGCYLLAATESHAQACPQLAESGTYTATVPHQASGCTMALERVGPELGTGALYCPGAPAPGSVAVAAPITPNAEGVCVMMVRLEMSGVLIADEGEDVYVATNAGWNEAGISDPTTACQATDHWHSLVDTDPAEAVYVSGRPDGGWLFRCRISGMHPAGFPLTTESSDFVIYLDTAVVPTYVDGETVVTATGETVEGLGVIDSMTTPDARVESLGGAPLPAGTVTIQRAEPPL